MSCNRTIAGRAILGAAFLCVAAASAHATANVSCAIDDAVLGFTLEGIAGSSGPIVQVNAGTIVIKPSAKIDLPKREFDVDKSHLVQQWIVGEDLRLDIEIENEDHSVSLLIIARQAKDSDSYAGGYTLTVARNGATKTLKGRIKGCEIG